MDDLNDMCFLDESEIIAAPPPPCKGHFYRGITNGYATLDGIRSKQELKLLKRKSCKGCSRCGWLDEHFENEEPGYAAQMPEVIHGNLYKLTVTSGGDGYHEEHWVEITYVDITEEVFPDDED